MPQTSFMQAYVLRRLLSVVKDTVKCLDFVFELRGSSKGEAARQFLQLNWEAVGVEAALANHLEVVRIRLTTYDDILLRWYQMQFSAVKAAFPQLPCHYGNATGLSIVMCRSSMPDALRHDRLQPFHYVPADFVDSWSWESPTADKPISRYLCTNGHPITFDVLGTVEQICLEDEGGRPYPMASVAIQPWWPLDAEVLHGLLHQTANPVRRPKFLSTPRYVTASKCMSVRYSIHEPWQVVPFTLIYDARDVPYGVHWDMPMLVSKDIKEGDKVIMECRVLRFRNASTPNGTWETSLELMALTLVEAKV
ncbi:hypothetical protein NM688_g1187 [Phlebia brevispora]|uniref:Uncharacterized protein n=1 Tax=Phlebia brevispora TaxID=194682 RepID=A0ACC1TCJ0_9APHY|nr:hypothetical protein NM688_g1187 [Phlebia brevispora]